MISPTKHGFQRIGFIVNNGSYAIDLRNLSQQYVDYNELNNYLDAQWDDKENSYHVYDSDLNRSNLEKTKFLIIDTGYKTSDGEMICGGFHNEDGDGNLLDGDWHGVKIGTQSSILEHWRDAYFGLATFTFIPNNDFTPIAYVLYKMTGVERTDEECSKLCQKSFADAQKDKKIGVYTPIGSRPAFAYFQLQCESNKGEALYLKMDQNTRRDAQPWFGARLFTQSDLLDCISSYHCVHSGDFRFASKQAMQAFYQDLAETAMTEKNWTQHADGSEPYGVLRSYIEHTYSRLLEEDRTARIEGNPLRKIDEIDGKAYFNSGLLNHLFRQIILVGNREEWTEDLPVLGKHTFTLISDLRHYSETDQVITDMYDGTKFKVPGIAKYFKNYEQIFFDSSLPIQLNDYHIFEDGVERGRLPKYSAEWETLKNDPSARNEFLARIARDFSSALERAHMMAERNYKLAVPQYWAEDSDIQFLLPIYLGEREESGLPECALALKKITTGRAPYYRGATILTLDMAYNNSRLLAKPDVFWLEQD